MKHILYFISTLLIGFTSTYAQGSKDSSFIKSKFIISNPEVDCDPSIEIRALRNAYSIVIDKGQIRFLTEKEAYVEEYKIEFISLSESNNVNYVRYDLFRGPFRRLQIEYGEVDSNHVMCTLKFFDISGREIYRAHTDHLEMYEKLELTKDVK
ncbi:hypothetical protein [Flammeovirga aprica]|uniref:Uncharacterized protein n=1 Tax=Flammeovirga aprica JL-4 TaxID=694437 RepID=A0A7X9P2L2_9BACT|nr:hypothetical protein [Flammeovirga aprica]NME68275.1 hypothetical protein [Flammeovirga aprica JL-4]